MEWGPWSLPLTEATALRGGALVLLEATAFEPCPLKLERAWMRDGGREALAEACWRGARPPVLMRAEHGAGGSGRWKATLN